LSSLFADKHLTRAEAVETISLTEYFGMRGIADALVKIDVEGAGEKVWDGAVETSNAIRYLVMEMLAPEIEAGLREDHSRRRSQGVLHQRLRTHPVG
jgi:hypothetical protein